LPHFSVTAGFIYMKERPLLEMPTVMDVSVDGAVKAFPPDEWGFLQWAL
jgi:hypothetical protein